MISALFQNGQRVIAQVVEWAQNAWQTTFANRTGDYSQAGICKNYIGEFTIIPGSGFSVIVGSGVAYDLSGDRIYIASTDTTPYNPNNPNQTTNDGTGNLVPTPQSTGCVNVPLTPNSTNYIWIDYLQTVSTTLFTLQDITLAKQFYDGLDGYVITVTIADVPPDANSIFLGSVNLTGGGVVSPTTISQIGRTYSANYPYRTLVETPAVNRSDVTTSYGLGETYFVDDHVKAIGTGVVTPTNAHGLSPADIGIAGASSLQFHQEFLHSPGLVGNPASMTSSLYGEINNITPGFDQFIVFPLAVDEVITGANGTSLTSTNLPNQTILQFTNTDAPGIWYIYVDFVNLIVNRTQVDLITSPNINYYLLYTVVYAYPDPDSSNGHLSAKTDYRVFGNIATRELQEHSVTGIKINPSALGAALSKNGSDDIQVNVDNSTIIINGSNELACTVGTNPGAGLILSGPNVLAVNPDNTTVYINGSNQVAVVSGGITSAQIAASTVTGGNIASATITGGNIASGTISGGNIGSGTISGGNIGSGTISGGNIGSGTITSTNLADGSVSTRAAFSYSFGLGGSQTDFAAYESNTFSIPSTSQGNVQVSYDVQFTVTAVGAGTCGIGISIDNSALWYCARTTSGGTLNTGSLNFAGSGGGPSPTTNPATTTITFKPSIELGPGTHTLYIWGAGISSGINYSGAVYLEWVSR
jgi:hypothetical protein